MNETVIDIGEDGTVESMHNDDFPLSFLGKMKIRRASEITFNIKTQKWDINLIDEEGNLSIRKITGFDGYDIARRFEVDWLQECRKQGIKDPLSSEGILAANCTLLSGEDK